MSQTNDYTPPRVWTWEKASWCWAGSNSYRDLPAPSSSLTFVSPHFAESAAPVGGSSSRPAGQSGAGTPAISPTPTAISGRWPTTRAFPSMPRAIPGLAERGLPVLPQGRGLPGAWPCASSPREWLH